VTDCVERFDAFVPLRCGRGNEVVVYAGSAQRFVYGQNRALQVRLASLMPWIARVVRLRAEEDERLADELFQVARAELVLIDVSRLDPNDGSSGRSRQR
jgi:hypothetical protein